ncbi:MAG TPA: hypothetical protein VFV92_06465 [Candidatus Bathyarchaeia archaeon]|nr:hypothetical protein [Candidatus Bathyarchaeia archaeon]
MGRFRFLRDDALRSFIRIVAWILLPFAVGLAGLVLLTTWMTALLWVAMIVGIGYAYLRFFEKHNQHEEYDDRFSPDKYDEGLRTYIDLIKQEKSQKSETQTSSE